jgi:hypothetical protein
MKDSTGVRPIGGLHPAMSQRNTSTGRKEPQKPQSRDEQHANGRQTLAGMLSSGVSKDHFAYIAFAHQISGTIFQAQPWTVDELPDSVSYETRMQAWYCEGEQAFRGQQHEFRSRLSHEGYIQEDSNLLPCKGARRWILSPNTSVQASITTNDLSWIGANVKGLTEVSLPFVSALAGQTCLAKGRVLEKVPPFSDLWDELNFLRAERIQGVPEIEPNFRKI